MHISFHSQPKLQPLDGVVRNFTLLEDFPVLIDERTLNVPAGFMTDLASIPSAFESVISNDAPIILRPSILHDYLYHMHGMVWPGEKPLRRFECDNILCDAMESCGADLVQRQEVLLAVRSAGWIYWGRFYPEPTVTTKAALLMTMPRSPKWETVRDAHLKLEGWCRFCAETDHLQVHHILPFHLHPELELDPVNLITLCMRPNRECHFRQGHFGDWSKFNPNIRSDAHRAKSGQD